MESAEALQKESAKTRLAEERAASAEKARSEAEAEVKGLTEKDAVNQNEISA